MSYLLIAVKMLTAEEKNNLERQGIDTGNHKCLYFYLLFETHADALEQIQDFNLPETIIIYLIDKKDRKGFVYKAQGDFDYILEELLPEVIRDTTECIGKKLPSVSDVYDCRILLGNYEIIDHLN